MSELQTHEARRVALESGATTTVECWGEAGPALLCVHGITSSRRDFTRLGEALAATHRVFAYDQRGHGDAETDRPMALDVLAADLRAVADSIGTVAAVVGHSWGGAVALVGGPKVARALVLVEPLIRVAPGTFDREYVDELAEVLGNPPGTERDDAVRAMFADADHRDRDGKVHGMRALQLDTLRRLGSDNRVDDGGWDLRARLAALKIPATILLAGDASVVAPDDLAGASATVRAETFDGHGHTLHRSAFDRFAEIVREAVPA
ncbi:MAG: alpha/beta hydrolase [Candidatus Eremiobacteraeota bacterium]|nr:alpha/beta hydrolase [Candidatus Eremiobacteraeota bacterium]